MTKRKNKKLLPLLAFAAAFMIWGTNTVFIKISIDALPTSLYILIRFGLATLILLPFMLNKYKKLRKKQWIQIISSSIIGLVIFMVLMGEGLKRTSAIEASLIFLTGPVFMYVLSIEVLKEKFNAKILLGLLVALCGSLVVVAGPILTTSTAIEQNDHFIGNALILIGVFISVVGTIIIKPALKKVDPLQVTTLRFLTVTACVLPITYMQRSTFGAIEWSNKVIFALAFNIIMASIVAYLLYHYGLKKISGEQSSVLHYLDPLFGVLGAIFILGDELTPLIILGGALTVIGIYLSEVKIKLHVNHLRNHINSL